MRGLLSLGILLLSLAAPLLQGQAPLPRRARLRYHAPTFSDQIVRIFQQRCQVCHHPGEVAPFSLMEYGPARQYAGLIADATQRRFMPPWKPVPGFGEFEGERVLTEREIDLIRRWVQAGAPLGDPRDQPAPLQFSDRWTVGEPDLVLTIDRDYRPDPLGEDDYRCFSIPSELLKNQQIGAVEIRPGNREIVHHVLVFPDPTGVSATLQAPNDPQPGYSCFGDPGFVPAGLLGGWAPGARPLVMPEGVVYTLTAGSRVAIQVHYHPDGALQADRTQVGLYFTEQSSPRELLTLPLINDEFVIPAGAKDYEVTASFTVPPFVKVRLLSVAPHMHLLGREIKAELIHPGGKIEPLIYIDDWDFEWQDWYWFKEPIVVPPLSRLKLTAIYDNSEDNFRNPNRPPKPVGWGPRTTDEMALVFFGAVLE